MPLKRLRGVGISIRKILENLRAKEKKPLHQRTFNFAELNDAERGILAKILAPTLADGFRRGDSTKILVIIAAAAALFAPVVTGALAGGLTLQFVLHLFYGIKRELAESLGDRIGAIHVVSIVINPDSKQVTVFYEK